MTPPSVPPFTAPPFSVPPYPPAASAAVSPSPLQLSAATAPPAAAGLPLVVMYHYVHEVMPVEPSGVRPLLAAEFERQLDFLSSRYWVCTAREFLTAVAGGARRDGRPPCLLTFDDGTADHATVVTPILRRRGLSGVFFVLSGPAEEGIMPLTHAVHWALGQGDEAVWAALSDAARAAGVEAGEEGDAARMYHYEPALRGRIKYAANVALPGEVVRGALEGLALRQGTSLGEMARGWFVSAEQVREMHEAGMTIGLHGHSHRSLQQMGAAGVREEMRRCAAFVRRATGSAGEGAMWWACPFGGTGAPAELHGAMREASVELGVVGSVSTEAREVRWGEDPLRLPRVDCVRLPPRGRGM